MWARAARWVALLTAALLAGCSALPVIVPDMAMPRTPVQFEGSNGRVLSAARSKAILERLKAGGSETSIFDRHLALEQEIAGAPLSTGNAVALLQDGPATYTAMFAAIRAARDDINMETYILDDDEVGRKFADALIAKQQQGVQVNLIHDGVGTLGTPREFFTRLSDAGINVLEFNPVNPLNAKAGWDVNQRDHRKILIVDGKTAFLGGINISGVYSGGSFGGGSRKPKADGKNLPWRDTDLQVNGPVVADLQKLFVETWQQQKGKPLAPRDYFPKLQASGNEVVRAIAGAPDEPLNLIYATFISAINSAETQILLTNAYFVPDPQLVDALLAAVARGVDVKMILPSVTDSSLVFHAGRAHYDRLLSGGVKLYEREDVLLHSKTALIDGIWSTVGSTNLDWRSFLHNQEVNVVVIGAEFGERMRASFDRDLAASRQITLETWRRRPLDVRLKELFARAWEYWL
ncbi:MAG: cardiolipin synthase [Pseudomonadota bacterium]|nr:cardiolipin synthase [Pseudomonadota bacterium]